MKTETISRCGLVCCLLTIGCATASGGGTVSGHFPSAMEVEQIEQRPAPPKIFKGEGIEIERWELAGPLPARVEMVPHRDEGPWQPLLAERAAARPGRVLLSERLHCVARETGRFYLGAGALPDLALDRFIRARCGAVTGPGSSAWLSADVPEESTDAQIAEHFTPRLKELLGQILGAGSQEAGIWFGRKGPKALVMMSWATSLAKLDPLSFQSGADGRIRLSGESLLPASTLNALVTRGSHGFSECTVDTRVPLPRFAIECSVTPDDPVATIEVIAFPPGRILGSDIVTMTLWPSSEPSNLFLGPRGASAPPASIPIADSLLGVLNQIRDSAGLALLSLAPAQSATATRVAPYYFAAQSGFEPDTVADTIALGLIAGWKVDGLVQRGRFTAGFIADGTHPAQLIREALMLPSARRTLLDPEARKIAIGPLVSGKTLAAVISTYALFEEGDHSADEEMLLQRVGAERIREHRAAPTKVVQLCNYAREAAGRVRTGLDTPRRAMDRVLESVGGSVNRLSRAWVIESESLATVRFPDEILGAQSASLGIAVTHWKPLGSPWGHYVILLVMVDPPASTSDAPQEQPSW